MVDTEKQKTVASKTIDKPGCTGCNACLYRLGNNQDNGCVNVELWEPLLDYISARGAGSSRGQAVGASNNKGAK